MGPDLCSPGKELDIIKEKLWKNCKLYELESNKMCHYMYHYMCLGKNKENNTFNFENKFLTNSKEEVILGLTIDNKLSFDNHVKKIFINASQKTCALSRL